MTSGELDLYSKGLGGAFPDDDDSLALLTKLATSEREKYEEKIPPLSDLIGMIRRIRGVRLRAEEERREAAEYDAMIRDQREHPENYFSIAELAAEVSQRVAAKRATERHTRAEDRQKEADAILEGRRQKRDAYMASLTEDERAEVLSYEERTGLDQEIKKSLGIATTEKESVRIPESSTP